MTGTAPAAKPLPAYVSWKDPGAIIVHTSGTLETRRSAFGTSVITPNDQLYIRNNLPAPDASYVADRDAWEITVEGVKTPRKLTVKELKTMGPETVTMVLQCSGNGRGLFPSKPSGTPLAGRRGGLCGIQRRAGARRSGSVGWRIDRHAVHDGYRR